MFCSKGLGVPALWDFLVGEGAKAGWAKPAGALQPWHLQVPIRTAELVKLRHFQENIVDRGHFRSVLVLVKSGPV